MVHRVVRHEVSALIAAVALAGCSVEPGRVVTEEGPVSSAAGTDKSSFGVFRERYDALIGDQGSSEKAFGLVEAGTQLQYQLCSSFFASAGRQQQALLFSKDLITFVATAAAGALGAARASPASIAWIGLGGAGAVTGINVYARNYLFSEDNVEAVQDLTLRALGAARDAALAPERRNVYTLSSAISTIMDVQSVCEVQHIINLSRDAIKNGTIAVSTDQNLNNSLAFSFEASLGNIVKGGVALTYNELAGLYWLFRSNHPPASAEQKRRAAAALAGLAPPPLLATGDTNAAWKQSARVSNILATIPAALADTLETSAQANSAGSRDAAPAAPDAVRALAGSPGRISVRIQPSQ